MPYFKVTCVSRLLFILVASIFAHTAYALPYPNFDANPLLDNEMKRRIEPYLIPISHPLKPLLDAIFASSRVVQDEASLIGAGFKILHRQPSSFVIVASHPACPGYLFKMYLDSETRLKYGRAGWEWLRDRCAGAARIRKILKKGKIRHFIVPDKWLYLLPLDPPIIGPIAQPLILVVTDMDLADKEVCREAWKSVITKEHLKEFHYILSQGAGSWFVVNNVPYTNTGKFAFIDTEYPKRKISLYKLGQYLSEENKKYWDKLIKK